MEQSAEGLGKLVHYNEGSLHKNLDLRNLQKDNYTICYSEGWIIVAVFFFFCSLFLCGVMSYYRAIWDRNNYYN